MIDLNRRPRMGLLLISPERFQTIGAFAYHMQTFLLIQLFLERPPQFRIVIHQQHANFFHTLVQLPSRSVRFRRIRLLYRRGFSCFTTDLGAL